jgi:crotonobetainyl-CoA:carnitine CoA-transferase CaiB-like acyl-CoA transferase
MTPTPSHALAELWQAQGLPQDALPYALLTGEDPVLPSSFRMGAAAQVSLAAAALAAMQWGRVCGQAAQRVTVPMQDAAMECVGHFAIDGRVPELWDKYSGMYRTADGWVRIHANFAHHRDAALALLNLKAGDNVSKAEVELALQSWRAEDFESAATQAGGVAAALRSRDQWLHSLLTRDHAAAIMQAPLVGVQSIAPDAMRDTTHYETRPYETPRRETPLPDTARPLRGLKVLDLTRIIAGPTAARTLAGYGADVLMINAPHLPNIEAIADMSRGKRSAQLDLRTAQGKETLKALIAQADIFLQGYRPGALAALGFSGQDIAAMNPNIVIAELSAFGFSGELSARRGFDSIVQTATGLNADESIAAGVDIHAKETKSPKAFPVQMLDYAGGYLLAFGALAALIQQRSAAQARAKLVQISLARTAEWVRSLGRLSNGLSVDKPALAPYLYTTTSGFGELTVMRHAAQFERTPASWDLPSMPPGSHAATWLD